MRTNSVLRLGHALWALSVLALLGGSAMAQQQLVGPDGFTYTVDTQQTGGMLGPSPYEAWPQLCVRRCENGCALQCPDESIYRAGGGAVSYTDGQQGLQMPGVQLAGLTVSRHVWTPAAGPENANGFVVYYDELINPTAEPITVSIRLGSVNAAGGNLRPSSAQIWRTHSDDALLEARDRWFLADDNDAFGGAASLAVLMHGAGARKPLSNVSQSGFDATSVGDIFWEFSDHVVEPGGRHAFVSVLSLNPTRTAALNEIESLLRMRQVDVLFAMSEHRRRAVQNFDIDPGNGSPVSNAGGPYSTEEGLPIALSGVFSYDSESANLEFRWDFTDDQIDNFDDAQTANAAVSFPDNGTYFVRLRVTDESGKFDIDSARIQVRNVAPRVDAVATSSPVDEGELLEVQVDASDPGADQLTYQFDWDGDGVFDTEPMVDNRVQHRYLEDGQYNAVVRVHDDDGDFVDRTFSVHVSNTPPVINQVVAPPGVAEGSTFEVRVISEDSGGDAQTYGYDLDGDNVFELSGLGLDRIELSYPDDGLYTLVVQVCDDQGACSTVETPVNVGNVRPEIQAITATSPIIEGQSSLIQVVASDVPGDELLYAFDLNNDGDYDDDITGQLQPQLTIPFADDGIYVIGVRVDDGDGGRITDVVRIEVINAPPTARVEGANSTRQGQQETFTCLATDPGTDRLRYDWDLDGDGLYEIARGQQQVTRAFRVVGPRTLRCRVSDGDGGVTIAEHALFVSNRRPDVSVELSSPQNEGTEVVIRALGFDAGGDELSYLFDVNDDGVVDYGPTDEAIVRHVYPDDGLYTVRIWADDGTDRIDATALLRIVNVAPTARLTIQSPVDEGQEVVLTAEVVDPGDDPVTLQWDLDGDGIPDDGVTDENVNGIVERRFPALDDGRFDVTIWATDDEGARSTAAQALVIRNLPPRFPEQYTPPSAREGQPYNRSIPASDPAGVADLIRYSIIDPPPGVEIEANTGLLLWTPSYEDFLNSPVVLRIRIDDGDGGSLQRAIPFEVEPIDEDGDGLPDTYERTACSADGVCLDPTNPDDAEQDLDMDGRTNLREWEDQTDPHEFEGPEFANLLFPEDGERVATDAPEFVVARAQDSQRSRIYVEFQILDRANGQDVLAESGRVEQPLDGNTRWRMPSDLLVEDKAYWWRARVVTDLVDTPWTAPWQFRVNQENIAPTSPRLISPADGVSLDQLRPILTSTRAMDGDDDVLRYVFRIFGPNGDIFTTGAGEVSADRVEFRPPTLIENTMMTWEVVAIDEASAESAPSERWGFLVDTENTPPTAPELVQPTNEELVVLRQPTLQARGSIDEDVMRSAIASGFGRRPVMSWLKVNQYPLSRRP